MATALALCAFSAAAQATPYAFASNQITGFTLTYADGTAITASSSSDSISDSAQFGAFGLANNSASGPYGSALTIGQAYSGPGSNPAATYTPLGAGSFTGARSDAATGSNSAGLTFSNVAEAYGSAVGSGNGSDGSNVAFTLQGTGQAIRLSFTDLVQLTASTAAVTSESASAQIQNRFAISAAGSNTPLLVFAPGELNQQFSSTGGSSNGVSPTTYRESVLTPILASGLSYSITFCSSANTFIQPGASATPEPGSFQLLVAALSGVACFGLLRRLRRA